MVKENQNIELISQNDFKNHLSYHLNNCIIKRVDLVGVFELSTHLIIENCIISDFRIHSCWFVNGLIIKNCIINNYIDYQMGGHNLKPMVLSGNVFKEFFNFFDCQFENTIELRNNIFDKGTNLLGNKGEGFENTFAKGYIVENNIGNISVDEINI